MTNKTYRSGDLSELFGVHQNTIRSYVGKIENHLSEDATAKRRKYTERDALIIYTVVKMRDIGISFDNIAIAISEGRIEESLPEVDTPEVEQAKDNVQIVTIPRDTYLIEQEALLHKIALIEQERDSIKQRLETSEANESTLQSRVIVLERDLSSAKAQLDIIRTERPSALFWLAVLLGVAIAVSIIVIGLTVYFV